MRGPLDHLFPDTEDDVPFASPEAAKAYMEKLFGPMAKQPKTIHCLDENGNLSMTLVVDDSIVDD